MDRTDDADNKHLTPLDALFRRAVDDTYGGVVGALTTVELNDCLEEISALTTARPQTFFHFGYRDAAARREVSTRTQADNRDQRVWYLIGYIRGLHKRAELDAILHVYDEWEEVKTLHHGTSGSRSATAAFVFEALCWAERHNEAAEFVSTDSVRESEGLQDQILRVATSLVREEQYALAEPMLRTLSDALAERNARNLPVRRSIWNDARRRYATCLRQTGSSAAATDVLEELLLDPHQDLNNRAAVLTDLGLEAAGYRRLHELHLPEDRGLAADIITGLTAQFARFKEAASISEPYGRHADYVMGFLKLLAGDYAGAVDNLEAALAVFGRRPDVYRGGKLLARARLHLAVAQCYSVTDYVKLRRAGEWIADAVRQGVALPTYLLEDILSLLGSIDGDTDVLVAEALLDSPHGSAFGGHFDLVFKVVPFARSPKLTDALQARTYDTARTTHARTKDARLLLGAILKQRRLDEADEVLGFLEAQAHEGVDTAAFIALLEDESNYSPAWDPEDAVWGRVFALESQKQWDRAGALLEEWFHRVLTSQRHDRLDRASDVLGHIEKYVESDRAFTNLLDTMRGRYDSTIGAKLPRNTHTEGAHAVRILVAGGDERQARLDDTIRRELQHSSPGLQVEFVHSGFSSNWGAYVDEVKRQLPSSDGVVLIYLMRTHFGRTVRRLCGHKPWRTCGSGGKNAIVRSIRAAADAALSQMSS